MAVSSPVSNPFLFVAPIQLETWMGESPLGVIEPFLALIVQRLIEFAYSLEHPYTL